MVNFHGQLPWSISMVNYHGQFPWSITMVNFHGKSPWFKTMVSCHELVPRTFAAQFWEISTKIFFFVKNNFFRTKISIFFHNFDFWPKCLLWPKKIIFDQKCRFWTKISISFNFRSFFSENIFFDYRNEIYAIDYPRKFEKMVKIVHRKKKLRLAENVLAASI